MFFDDGVDHRHEDESQPCKPAVDEYDGLRGFKDVDPCGEEVGGKPFSKHERPGVGDVAGFEACCESTVRDLDNENNERSHGPFGRQRPCGFFGLVGETVFVAEGCPHGEAE